MYRIYICDDERSVVEGLNAYVTSIAEDLKLDIVTHCFFCAEDLLEVKLNSSDIVLLDISMDKVSGMQAARELRKRNVNAVIIFISSMTQYALEGYDVHAFAFLAKPVTKELLKIKIQEAIKSIESHKGKVLVLKSGFNTYRINTRDVIYIDVLNHNTCFTTTKGKLTFYVQLKSVENQIPSDMFFRIHKSYIANMDHIMHIQPGSVIMSNGEELPIGKSKKEEFLMAYSAFAERYLR